MVPAGDPTQETVDKLAKLLDRGDTIVDGGNSRWTDDKRRAKELKSQGIDYVDVGVSGGVWGLEVGYCMMVGGPPKAVKRLAPILDVLAPADQRAEPRRDRAARLAALRPVRRRALREDGPQRRRVRADAGLRRGLRPVRQVRVRARQREDRAPVGPGIGRALVAVRTGRARLRSRRQRAAKRSRATPRTPARAAGRSRTRPRTTCRRRSSPPRCTRAFARAATATSPTACSRRCATSSAGTRSRARRRAAGSPSTPPKSGKARRERKRRGG